MQIERFEDYHFRMMKLSVPELLKKLGIGRIAPETITGSRIGGDPEDERKHFYICVRCGQAVDKRDLGQILHHEEPEHKRVPTQ